MNRSARASAAAGALAVVAAGIVVIAPTTASAATCSGVGCGGVDPYAASCTAASSITKTFTSGSAVATIVNEYSSICNANWVFAYENTAAQNAGWSLYLDVHTTVSINGGNAEEDMCSPDPIHETDIGSPVPTEICPGALGYGGQNGWPMWTDMVDGTQKAYGELAIYNSAGSTIGTVSDPQ